MSERSRASTTLTQRLTRPRGGGWAWLLAIALCLLGVGNLVFPPTLRSALPVDYLYVCLAVCIAAILVSPARVIANLSSPLMLGLFLLSIVPGFVTSDLNPYGTSKVLGFVIAFILMIAPSTVVSGATGTWSVIKVLTIGAGVTAILLLTIGTQVVAGRESLFGLNPIGIGRMTGLFVALAGPLVLLGLPRRKLWRAVLVVAIPVAVIATFSTGSRGPVVGAGAAIIVTVLVIMARRQIRPGLIALIGMAAVLTFIFLASSNIAGFDRIVEGNDSGRIDLFGETIRLFLAHPLGVGWGDLANYFPRYAPFDGYTLYPHNFFLEIAVEGGIVALVGVTGLILAIILRLIRAIRTDRDAVPPLVLAFLTYGLIGAQFSGDIVGNRIMWLGLGIGLVQVGAAKLRQNAAQGRSAYAPKGR